MTGDTKRGIAVASALVVALGVLIAVVVEHNREPVFDARLRTWKTPVVFGYTPGMIEFAGDLASAIDDLNNAVGCPVASIDSDKPDVLVSWLGDSAPCSGLDTSGVDKDASYYQCPGTGGYIVVRRLFTHGHARVLFRHELGHVMGLADENTGGSVMNSPPAYDDRPAPTWTPKDVEAMTMRYCP